MNNTAKCFYQVKELLSENGGPLPISRSAAYSLVLQHQIPSVRLGRKILIPANYIDELLMHSK